MKPVKSKATSFSHPTNVTTRNGMTWPHKGSVYRDRKKQWIAVEFCDGTPVRTHQVHPTKTAAIDALKAKGYIRDEAVTNLHNQILNLSEEPDASEAWDPCSFRRGHQHALNQAASLASQWTEMRREDEMADLLGQITALVAPFAEGEEPDLLETIRKLVEGYKP